MQTKPLTEEEYSLILNQFSCERDKALFIFGCYTGFRISEILSLTLRDILDRNGIVRNTISVARRNMKGKHTSRSVPLHPMAHEALQAYIKSIEIEGDWQRLFPISRVHAWRVIKEASHKAGIEVTIGTQGMRKTFAQRVYKNSERNVVLTQHALGHKSLSSTTHYLSVGSDEVESCILSI